MAKTTSPASKNTPSKTTTKEPVPVVNASFAFGKINYIILFISIALVVIGYVLMAGGKPTDPAVFNEEVFSFRRITLAPIVVMAGYALGVYSIVKKAD